MRVRPAKLGDAEGAALAFARVAEEGVYIGRQAPVDVALAAEQVRGWVASPDEHFWILEDQGRVVGTLAVLRVSHAPGVATLGMLVVPEARGGGGGRQLLDAALEWARESDLHKLELEVFVENGRAIGLYASAGFQIEGLRRDRYRRQDGSLRSTLIMALAV
jgi:putative acetyltransferase